MAETVDVVAAKPLMVPAGQMEAGDVFTTTRAHADQLAAMEMVTLEKGDAPAGERAATAGAKARAKLEAEAAKAAREAERQAAAEAAPAPAPAAKD